MLISGFRIKLDGKLPGIKQSRLTKPGKWWNSFTEHLRAVCSLSSKTLESKRGLESRLEEFVSCSKKVVGCSRVSQNKVKCSTRLSGESCQISWESVRPPKYLPKICLRAVFLQTLTVISSTKTPALMLPVLANKANKIQEKERVLSANFMAVSMNAKCTSVFGISNTEAVDTQSL